MILGLPNGCAVFGKSNSRRRRNKIVPSIITTDPNKGLKKTIDGSAIRKAFILGLPKGCAVFGESDR